MTLVVVVALVRFRSRGGATRPAEEASAQSRIVEPAWIVVLVAIAVVLVVATFRTETRVDALAARPALTVRVEAGQWTWAFAYAGTPVVQRSGTAETDLVLPAGRTVRFEGRSLDVVHAFWVPQARFQRQLFPGHVERWDLAIARAGDYEGACSMFCGLYHDRMAFRVRVLAPAAFDDWLRQRSGEAGT